MEGPANRTRALGKHVTGCSITKLTVHEAVAILKVEVEGVEDPARTGGKAFEFAAGAAKDLPEGVAGRPQPPA